jgi:hypothetical protein
VGKLQTGRFERLAARTYSIKGPGALVDLDETVLGVLQLERQAGMESHLMQEWETFGQFATQPSAAGVFCYLAISNPVDSGSLMVIDGWQRSVALLMDIFISRGVPPGFGATAGVGQGLDTRIPAAKQPVGRMFDRNTNIASFGTLIGEQSDASRIDFPIVLAPDGTLIFRAGVLNEPLSVSIRWAERVAAPFELQ